MTASGLLCSFRSILVSCFFLYSDMQGFTVESESMQQSGVFRDTSQPVGKSLPVIDSSWQLRFSGCQAAQAANPFCNVSLQVCEPNNFQAQLEPGITDFYRYHHSGTLRLEYQHQTVSDSI